MKTCPLCDAAWPNTHATCPTDGALLIESRDLEPGTVIRGKYRIQRLLGRGGMGTVYLAEHILLSRPRALKFISGDLSQDPRFLKRFRHEAQAASELHHPNVVQVLDLDQAEDGSPYIAMEYVEGQDLRHALSQAAQSLDSGQAFYQGKTAAQSLDSGQALHPDTTVAQSPDSGQALCQGTTSQLGEKPVRAVGRGFIPGIKPPESAGVLTPEGCFSIPRALAIARGIAEGLGAAHAKGIVHRDIKPENILLTSGNETPKLLDFGIAAMKESATAISRTHGLLLTPPYAAPEQWKGLPAEDLDDRTDLYALGCVVYEMLTGQTPFQASNAEGWMYQHLHEEPQPLSQLRPESANWQGLDALVLRLLAKDRNDRPKDVSELLGLLDAVRYLPPEARWETVSEDAAPAGKRMGRKRIRRVPLWVWAASVAFFLVAALAAVRVFAPRLQSSLHPPKQLGPGDEGYWTITPPQPSSQPQPPQTYSDIPPGNKVVETAPRARSTQSTKPDFDMSTLKPLPGPRSTPKGDAKPPVERPNIAEIEQQAEALWDRKRYAEAAPLLDQSCTGGNMDGCTILGRLYDDGLGVAQDYAMAHTLYRKACDNGGVIGCNNLGLLYEKGQGVAQDYAQARSFYQKVCDAGQMLGCTNLGFLYDIGKGGAQDYAQARTLYLKACDGGELTGCTVLGNLYYSGHGVAKDSAQARTLYKKACDGGNEQACTNLGNLR